MKSLIAVWICASMLGVATATEILDGVAAVVNDKLITYSEVREYVQPVAQQLRRNYTGKELIEKVRSAQMDALNNLIERTLILQEYKSKGFNIPETVFDQQLNDVIANDFGGDRAAFIKTLQAQNMTLSQYREQLRDRIIVQAMRNSKTQREVVVSPYKIEKYYLDHADDFKVEDQIKLRMIFIKRSVMDASNGAPSVTPLSSNVISKTTSTVTDVSTNGTTNTTSTVTPVSTNSTIQTATPPPIDPRRLLGESLVKQLDAGAKFDELAKNFSEAKEAKIGGAWGWIGRDTLRKELNEVAFKLKPGQHSKLIETPEGYYILNVEEIKLAHTRPLDEVRDEIEKILLQQQKAKMQADWIKDLRSKAYIRLN